MESLEKGHIPVSRGYILNPQDILAREAISGIMCSGELDLGQLAAESGMNVASVKEFFAYDPARFRQMEEDGLLEAGEHGLKVSPLGMLLVRVIAREFDPAFSSYRKEFSKVI
jgi:oxygen-independent coproporphyrinogen-3 oxidase